MLMIPDATSRDVMRTLLQWVAHTCITWGCCLASVAKQLERHDDDDDLPRPKMVGLRAQA